MGWTPMSSGSVVDRVSSTLTTPRPLVSRALDSSYSSARVSNRPSPTRCIASDNLSDTPRLCPVQLTKLTTDQQRQRL